MAERKTEAGMTYIIIKHSSRFWEVRPGTKRGMAVLLEYIKMCGRWRTQ